MDIGKHVSISKKNTILVIILRKIQIQRKRKKQHQAAVSAILMFLKKVRIPSTCRNILFDCLKNLESKVSVI